MRILVVDDDEMIRDFVSMTLADEGFEVVSAENGAVALDLIATERVDLILVDWRMPVMDGQELVRRYRRSPGPHALIVVFTAGRGDEGAAAAEADAVLTKPFDLDQLLALVNRLLGRA